MDQQGALDLLMFVFVFAYPKFHADEVIANIFWILLCSGHAFLCISDNELERGLYLAFLVFLCSWGYENACMLRRMLIGKEN